jgi:AraC family transcriptional regulator
MPPIRLYLWPHRLLLLGPGFGTGVHRHHAAQICLGLDGPLSVRAQPNGRWEQHDGFYIAPDQPHEFVTDSTSSAILYVDAESKELTALQRSLGAGGLLQRWQAQPSARMQLQSLVTRGGPIERAAAACLAVLGLPHELSSTAARFHPRIAECLSIIPAQLERPVRLAALASTLHVSSSWLAHRFSAEVGVPLRRYVLWQRLWRAVAVALQGRHTDRSRSCRRPERLLTPVAHVSTDFRRGTLVLVRASRAARCAFLQHARLTFSPHHLWVSTAQRFPQWAGLPIVGEDLAVRLPRIHWGLFSRESREVFRTALAADDATWERGRGQALSQSLLFIPYYLRSNPTGIDVARRIIDAIFEDRRARDT